MEEKINILLIEDNPSDARLIDIYLDESNEVLSNLSVAETLSAGLEFLAKKDFDIIIVDLNLPDSNGLNTFNVIHERTPGTPVIVLTGFEDEITATNAVKAGAQDFLIKGNIKHTTLLRSINYSIERNKLLKRLSENAAKLEERTEELLRERQKLSEAQKLAHIGNWEWDLMNNTMNWSDEMYRIHALQPGEISISYEKMFELTHAADREQLRKAMDGSRKTKKPFALYYRIVLSDKSVKTLHTRGEVIVNEKGEAAMLFGTSQDVTERIHEEEMEKLALAATKSYNSVIIANRDGTIEWVNEGFTKLTGYTLEDVKSSHGELLTKGLNTGLSKETDTYKAVIRDKKPITYESKNFAKDGKEYWMITTLSPVLNKEGEVERIIAIDSDISLRKEIEEDLIYANKVAEQSLRKGNKALDELMKAKRQVEESVKIKEQFLANMSHEIRTPMNAIVGFTDLILKTPLTDEQKQYIDAIRISGQNLLVIINDILDFSRLQSGKISLEKIGFRLSQVMSTFTEMLLPKSVEKNIKLSTVIDKKIQDNLIGDPTRLNQVLLNLVGNAIKFTEKGEVKASVKLLSEDADKVNLEFTVSDTGIGIPEKKLKSVFDSFTQATSDTTRKYGGSGLGLAIVKQLVEVQGGSVSVKSELGKGSEFTFILPFSKNLFEDPNKESLPQEIESNASIEGLNILLVEDNVLNQVLARKVLTDWKCNVDIAENGLVAVEKLKEKNFDLVLMDIQLPEMDGYEATRYIRREFPEPKCSTPILAMTAHAMSSEEEKCISAGMNGYISKPFNQKSLYNKIVSVMHKHIQSNILNGTQHKNGSAYKYIDLEYLKQIANGSDKFIAEMITLFLEQTPRALVSMEEYEKNKDWKALRGIAHKIRPSLTFVGLKELEQLMKDMEEYSEKQEHLEELPQMIQKTKEICEGAMKELELEKQHFS